METLEQSVKLFTKLTIKRPKRCLSGVFIVNFEHVSQLILVFLMVTFGQVNATGLAVSQPAFTCGKLSIETLEQGAKYVQS